MPKQNESIIKDISKAPRIYLFGHLFRSSCQGCDHLHRLGIPYDRSIMLSHQQYCIKHGNKVEHHRGDEELGCQPIPLAICLDENQERINKVVGQVPGHLFR